MHTASPASPSSPASPFTSGCSRPTWRARAAVATAGLATAALVTALTALVAPSAATPRQTASPAGGRPALAAPCSTSGLDVWLNTTGNGAAGSIYYDLELTNLSGHTCTLAGYPGVSAVSLTGARLGSAASRNPEHAAKVLTLVPGATAQAVLQIVEAGNFPATRCGMVTAAGLRVYPPNQAAAKLVPFPFQACSKPDAVVLAVEAVQPGGPTS